MSDAMTIQDRWPTLSTRERDAMVAKARGDTFKPDNRATTYAEYLKPYSTDWSLVGPLLEEMLAAGLFVELYQHGEIARLEIEAELHNRQNLGDEGTNAFEADSFPSAICLAYCCWKGIEP